MLNNIRHQILDKYLPPILQKLQKFPYLQKRTVFVLDLFFVAISLSLSYCIRYFFLNDQTAFQFFYVDLPLSIAVAGIFFTIFNTCSEFIRFTSFRNIMRIFLALFCTNLLLLLLFRFMPVNFFHYSAGVKVGIIISFLLSCCSILFFRMAIRIVYDYAVRMSGDKKKTPVLIYGIDAAHIAIAKMIRASEYLPYTVSGFILPKPLPHRHRRYRIVDCDVYSPDDVFGKSFASKGIKTVLVRGEDLHSIEAKNLMRRFAEQKIELLSAPPIDTLNAIRKMQKVRIEDLLRRDPIVINMESIAKNLKGKTVLITGAAGSIGSEIVRQLCQFDLDTLLLCDSAESPLNQLNLDINENTPHVRCIPLVADVRNQKRMENIFGKYKPHYVYHAAAYKHVPMMELYPSEAVMTNIMGTKVVADLAIAHGAECFVMISTDKVVNPSNVMGASKRIAEIYVHSLSTHLKKNVTGSHPRFITTRFGNVLGSNGSVIPLFAKQIAKGGPVTVTHPNIIRYFMTIPEACSLVLEAGDLGEGGEVFVFDMGDPVKIKDMAEEMIRLSGLEPYKDIDIAYTGLRPGEKLQEELLHDKESVKLEYNKNIMIGSVREYDYNQVKDKLEQLLQTATTYDEKAIVSIMKEMVPEFISSNSVYEALDRV